MQKRFYETVIISDLHLGSQTSRAKEALELLHEIECRRLILLGDIFCDLNFARLTQDHWSFLSHIRKLSNPKRHCEVVWVEGNHDHGLANLMSHLVGVRVYSEYIWRSAGESHLAIHGHQFDRFVVNDHLCLCSFGSRVFLAIQKLDSKRQRFARLLDRLNTRWLRLSTKVAHGAIAHARHRGANRVYCGHTHEALTVDSDGVRYYNSGAWATETATYITISEGEVAIHEYAERVDHSYPGEERDLAAAETLGLPAATGLPVYAFDDGVRC